MSASCSTLASTSSTTTAATGPTSICRSWRATSRRGCGTTSSLVAGAARGGAGTIRATVLIETILAAFEMDEILYELREHSSGLNAGRWDYIFSVIKKLGHRPEFVFPDRGAVTMTVPFMRAYSELLVKTCHRRGAHAMGGMAAFIPSRRDPGSTRWRSRRCGRTRSARRRRFDGTWVAHPDLVPRQRGVRRGARRAAEPARAPARRREGHGGRAARVAAMPGEVSEDGLRNNVGVGHPVPRGVAGRLRRGRDQQPDGGCRHGRDQPIADLAVDPPRQDHAPRMCAASPTRRSRSSAPTSTTPAPSSRAIATRPDYVEFLTLPAYDRLVADEA